MKIVLNIFFSWQLSSKTDKLNNKEFILSCIQDAANKVKGKNELKDVDFEVLQGTGGEPGTPNMIATCLNRNDHCHIFIADISVDKYGDGGQAPVPSLKIKNLQNIPSIAA